MQVQTTQRATTPAGAALGVGIIGGVFYRGLGSDQTTGAYAHAFSLALDSTLAALSPLLGANQSAAACPVPAPKPL